MVFSNQKDQFLTSKISKLLFIFIGFMLYIKLANTAYCSAYCQYQYNGVNNYIPKCGDWTNLTCTDCDERFFIKNGTTCLVHEYYNESMLPLELDPANINADLATWSKSYSGQIKIDGTSSSVELFRNNLGDPDKNRIYKSFTLNPHYSIRIRFFIWRDNNADFDFYYYIDSKQYQYNYGNFPSNLSQGDIITSSKITHYDSNLKLAFYVYFPSLKWVRIKQIMIFIGYCSTNCLICDSLSNCKQCGALPNGTKTYLYQGYCFFECPQTTYENNVNNTCDKCDNNCQNCDVNNTYCSQCKFQGRYEAFLFNNKCYYDCPNGFFKEYDTNTCICPQGYQNITNSSSCQICAPECSECTGPLRTQCTSCTAGNYLIQNTTWCSRTCPSDQYMNNLTKKCVSCAPVCGSCQNSATQCTSCFFVNSNRFLFNKQCIYQCPTGYGKNNLTHTCDKCPSYYYSFQGQCMMTCPQYYMIDKQSKSCLHLSQTNYTHDVIIENIEILEDQESMIIKLIFSHGLSQQSKTWLLRQSYFEIYLVDQNILNVPSQGITIENDNNVYFIFKIPKEIVTEDNYFIVNFTKSLSDSNKILYSKNSMVFNIIDNPQFLRLFYEKRDRNFYYLLFIPIFIGLFTLILFRFKATYNLLIQKIRLMQIIGLSIFVTYPVQSSAYYLLKGINYFNFQFLPNIYHMFIPNFLNTMDNKQYLFGYRFIYGDMDFFRMIGCILIFIIFWLAVLLVIKFIVKIKNQTFGWILRFGMDLIQIKILHSFWSSLLFTIINASSNNIFIFILHIFSYVFLGFVLFRYYNVYSLTKKINYLCVWRVVSTFLITIAVFQPIITFIALVLISLGLGIQQYKILKQKTKDIEKYKYGLTFVFRNILISIMPFLASLGISYEVFYKDQINCLIMIVVFATFQYVLVLIILIILIFLGYYYRHQSNIMIANIKKQDKWQQQQLYNSIEQNSTIGNVISQSQNQKSSYIKDQFDKQFNNNKFKDIQQQNLNKQVNNQKQNYDQQFDDQPVFNKLYRHNRSEIVKKRETVKIQPLKTIQNEKQEEQNQELQYEKIDLSAKPPKTVNNNDIMIIEVPMRKRSSSIMENNLKSDNNDNNEHNHNNNDNDNYNYNEDDNPFVNFKK